MTESSDGRDAELVALAEEFATRQRNGERPRLEEYCDRHPSLADDIRSLFPAMVELERVKVDAGADLAVDVAEAPPIKEMGDFRLLREVGRGGMGVVYEAEQISLGRRVAIKLLPASVFRDPNKRRRFEREAKAAAKLHHTNIVPVHGFAEHDGTPYYVMQFIPGLGLDAVIHELSLGSVSGRSSEPNRSPALSVVLARSLLGDEATGAIEAKPSNGSAPTLTSAGGATPDPSPFSRLDRSAAVSLSTSGIHLPGQSGSSTSASPGKKTTYWQSVTRIGVQVAGALAYAHKQGVLHRDIKPANLLLDLDGIVWVTDFGLAKADDSDNLTHTGDLLGTLRYMPPEAFEGKSDARSDVYALGLTLFEMVALQPAYEERDRNKLIKQVTTGDPPRLGKLRADAPRDLVTIVEKAIEKDPARRYQSAGALADDLQRFLDGRPITARRATELERLWMWAQRRPATAGLVAALFLCLLTGVVVSSVFGIRAGGFARDAEARAKDATVARDEAKKNEGEAVAARDEAKQTRNAAARQATALLLDRGIEDARSGEPVRALHLFVRALRTLPADDPQSAAMERVIRANLSAWAETVPALEHILPGGPRFTGAAFSADGSRFVMATGENAVQCFRTDTGEPVGPPIEVSVWLGSAMQFAPDGQSMWVATPGRAKVVKQWEVLRFDAATGQRLQPTITSPGPVNQLVVSPDGRLLVGAVFGLHASERGPVRDASQTRKWQTKWIFVWEAATGRVLRQEPVNVVSEPDDAQHSPDTYMDLSHDGKSVFAWIQRGLNRYDGMSFSVDGKELPSHLELPVLGDKAPYMLHLRNNMTAALAIKDGQVYRWSATKPGELGPNVPTPFRSMFDCPSADGRSIISPTDGRLYDTGAWPPRPSGTRFGHPGWQRNVNAVAAQSPDGRFATTWIWEEAGEGRLWRLPHPPSRPPLPPADFARQPERNDYYQSARFDQLGMAAAFWSPDPKDGSKSVLIVDLTTGARRETSVRHAHFVREIDFSPDGRYFATASFDHTARVWETATGRPAGPALQHDNQVATVAFSPDGKTLAAGDYGPDGLIKLWDWRTGNEVRAPLEHDDIILSVSFSDNGQYLAAIKTNDWSKNPELIVWDLASGKPAFRKSHRGPSYILREAIRFRSDGRVVMTRDGNSVLHLWAVPSGKHLGARPLDGDGVTRFSPDGRVVAAAANLGVRLLDGDTLEPLLGGYLPHPDPITDVAFSPDGAFLLTGHETGSAQLWDVATRKPIGPPAVLIGPIRAVTFTPDGKTCVCVAADGTSRRWAVPTPFVEPDLARLTDRIALMTGQRMDDNQGLDSVRDADWRSLRVKLVGQGSTALMPPRSEADWHDAAAADAEQDGDAFGAEWHLDRLAAIRADDWTIPARRARVLAINGRRDEAALAYAAAARLAKSPQRLADWLRAAAIADEATNRKELALWHLDRAIAMTPDDASLKPLVFNLTASTGDWKRTASLLKDLTSDPATPTPTRYLHGLASLKAGDSAGYRSACAGIAKRLPPLGPMFSPFEGNLAATAFVVGPNATDDWTKPLAWIDFSLSHLRNFENANPLAKSQLKPVWNQFLRTRGCLLFRAGRFEEAAKVLRESMSYHPQGGEVQDWAYLALVEQRLGHGDAAQAAATKARAAPMGPRSRTVWQRAETELLTAELDAAVPARPK
jgi:eukaryotic-like serine/threonine-protein kinase